MKAIAILSSVPDVVGFAQRTFDLASMNSMCGMRMGAECNAWSEWNGISMGLGRGGATQG